MENISNEDDKYSRRGLLGKLATIGTLGAVSALAKEKSRIDVLNEMVDENIKEIEADQKDLENEIANVRDHFKKVRKGLVGDELYHEQQISYYSKRLNHHYSMIKRAEGTAKEVDDKSKGRVQGLITRNEAVWEKFKKKIEEYIRKVDNEKEKSNKENNKDDN